MSWPSASWPALRRRVARLEALPNPGTSQLLAGLQSWLHDLEQPCPVPGVTADELAAALDDALIEAERRSRCREPYAP